MRQGDFGAIPGSPWVYWLKRELRNLFINSSSIESVVHPKTGLATADNVRFLRFWWEIPVEFIKFNCPSLDISSNCGLHWFPYMKGGGIKKWYGNQNHVVYWFRNAIELKAYERSAIRNPNHYFDEGITWSDVSGKGFAVRYLPPGFIFDMKGSSGFPARDELLVAIAVMNSPWMNYALGLLNPTISFQVGDISRVPFQKPGLTIQKKFDHLVPVCIYIRQWESMVAETTFDFHSPLDWQAGGLAAVQAQQRLINLETQINDLVYTLYEISPQDRQAIESELAGGMVISEAGENAKPEEEEEASVEVSVSRQSLALSWLSYAIGIILGRFYPGTPGALGSAIYRRSDFAIGSLPEPTEEELQIIREAEEKQKLAEEIKAKYKKVE